MIASVDVFSCRCTYYMQFGLQYFAFIRASVGETVNLTLESHTNEVSASSNPALGVFYSGRTWEGMVIGFCLGQQGFLPG